MKKDVAVVAIASMYNNIALKENISVNANNSVIRQIINQDYFDMFKLERSFNIDSSQLEKAYYNLQQQYHPDRIINSSSDDKNPQITAAQAVQLVMRANDGYKTLKSPLKRAIYLCGQYDVIINNSDQDNVKPESEVLTSVLEIRENIADNFGNQDAISQIESGIKSDIENIKQQIIKRDIASKQDALYFAQDIIFWHYLEKILMDLR